MNLDKHKKISGLTLSFSLIELLVVIAIIAIISSMIMPSLSNAVESARRISCASNLRNMGHVNVIYAEDNNGWGLCNMTWGFGIWDNRMLSRGGGATGYGDLYKINIFHDYNILYCPSSELKHKLPQNGDVEGSYNFNYKLPEFCNMSSSSNRCKDYNWVRKKMNKLTNEPLAFDKMVGLTSYSNHQNTYYNVLRGDFSVMACVDSDIAIPATISFIGNWWSEWQRTIFERDVFPILYCK